MSAGLGGERPEVGEAGSQREPSPLTIDKATSSDTRKSNEVPELTSQRIIKKAWPGQVVVATDSSVQLAALLR